MAVIEIARIQVRRGQENQTGVPRLDGGEFAWAADTEHLYIGLAVADGGSRDANVRILTENDERNFFALGVTSSTYTYRLGSYITALDGFSEEVERTVQERLDDDLVVSIRNFNPIPDGNNDNTALLQLAIDRLFLDTMDFETSTGYHPGKTLYCPSGTYNLTATIYLPKNTKIVGDGIDKTIFNVVSTGTHAFQTCDYSSKKGIDNYIHFDNTNTIDSINRPEGISIENVTIQFDNVLSSTTWNKSLLSLDCADDAIIRNVRFKGWYSPEGDIIEDYSGIDIRGFNAVTSENVLIDNCKFEGLYHGIRSNYDILNPIIQNNEFFDSVRGVSFNNPKDIGAITGPRYAKIISNRFENIEEEGIYAGDSLSSAGTFHLSKNNRFFNVGNYNNAWGDTSNTATSIINFLSPNNSSVDDYFGRYHFNLNRNITNDYYPLINGNAVINNSFVSTCLLPDGSNTVISRLPIIESPSQIRIKYNAGSGDPYDTQGELLITKGAGVGVQPVVTDSFNYNLGDVSLSWNVSVDPYSYLEIEATQSTGDTVPLTYQINIQQ